MMDALATCHFTSSLNGVMRILKGKYKSITISIGIKV